MNSRATPYLPATDDAFRPEQGCGGRHQPPPPENPLSKIQVVKIHGLPYRVQLLDFDIWRLDKKDGPPVLKLSDKRYFRFLDYLYIPCPTDKLTVEQILLINRFRESRYNNDTQFSYNHSIRQVFINAINFAGARDVLEIGPGRYPLLAADSQNYVLCDIDPMVLAHLRTRGYAAYSPMELLRLSPHSRFRICAASFVFHFSIDRNLIDIICKMTEQESILIFNVLTKHASIRTSLVSKLTPFGFFTQVLDLEPVLGKSDAIFVLTARGNQAFGQTLINVLRDSAERIAIP